MNVWKLFILMAFTVVTQVFNWIVANRYFRRGACYIWSLLFGNHCALWHLENLLSFSYNIINSTFIFFKTFIFFINLFLIIISTLHLFLNIMHSIYFSPCFTLFYETIFFLLIIFINFSAHFLSN